MTTTTKVKRAQPFLGTIVEITAYGNSAEQAVVAAFNAVREIHNLMSYFDIASDISRINRAEPNKAITVDMHTYHVLSFAKQLSVDSNGAFDITAAGNRLAEKEGRQYDKGLFRDVVLLPDNNVTRKKHVFIDLGGVAKGYAVDVATLALQAHGAESGIVNAGGDMRIFGAPQPIHIRYPNDANKLAFLGNMTDCAIASSSAVYGNEPLVSPADGEYVSWEKGFSIIAPECILADALTKIVRLVPILADTILSRYNAQAVIIDKDSVQTLHQEVGYV